MTTGLPAWLTSKIDQRMALIDERVTPVSISRGPVPLIVTPLTEPGENATPLQMERWERTCDACGKYCPYPKEDFFNGQVQRTTKTGMLVIIFFGVCKEHSHG